VSSDHEGGEVYLELTSHVRSLSRLAPNRELPSSGGDGARTRGRNSKTAVRCILCTHVRMRETSFRLV